MTITETMQRRYKYTVRTKLAPRPHHILGRKAIKVPTTISSMEGFTGRRIIYPSIVPMILHERRDNKHGAHAVHTYSSTHSYNNRL